MGGLANSAENTNMDLTRSNLLESKSTLTAAPATATGNQDSG